MEKEKAVRVVSEAWFMAERLLELMPDIIAAKGVIDLEEPHTKLTVALQELHAAIQGNTAQYGGMA